MLHWKTGEYFAQPSPADVLADDGQITIVGRNVKQSTALRIIGHLAEANAANDRERLTPSQINAFPSSAGAFHLVFPPDSFTLLRTPLSTGFPLRIAGKFSPRPITTDYK